MTEHLKASTGPVRVFLSYSHRDEIGGQLSSFVRKAIEACNAAREGRKLQLFVDESDILPGEQWRRKIDNTLMDIDIFLPCITPNYCLSKECAYEFTGFETVRQKAVDGRCCVPLFWSDVPAEYLEIGSFHADVLEKARAINGVEASSLVTRRTTPWQVIEKILVADLASALGKAADQVVGVKEGPAKSAQAFVCAGSTNRSACTMKRPTTCVALNAIKDNPSWGDERNFVLIKDVTGKENNLETASAGDFSDIAEAIDGHTYMIKVFINNAAADNLKLVARNVRVMASLPTATVLPSEGAMIQGIISADNLGETVAGGDGEPGAIWDGAYLKRTSGPSFKVGYELGSCRYYNNKSIKRGSRCFFLGDSLFTAAGASVGYEAMDGNIQCGFEYSGYVTFLVKVSDCVSQFDFFTTLRHKGDFAWKQTIDARRGDVLELKLEYINTGKSKENDVLVKVKLPDGLMYQPETTRLYNGNYPNGKLMREDDWIDCGLNLGNFMPDSNAILVFEVVLDKDLDKNTKWLKWPSYAAQKNGSKVSECLIQIRE